MLIAYITPFPKFLEEMSAQNLLASSRRWLAEIKEELPYTGRRFHSQILLLRYYFYAAFAQTAAHSVGDGFSATIHGCD